MATLQHTNLLDELKSTLRINTEVAEKTPVNDDPIVVLMQIKGKENRQTRRFIQKRGNHEDLSEGECNPMNKDTWNSSDCPPLPATYFHQNGCSHKFRCCTMKVLEDGSYYRDPSKICPMQWWQFEDDPEKEKLGTCPRFFRFPLEVEPKVA